MKILGIRKIETMEKILEEARAHPLKPPGLAEETVGEALAWYFKTAVPADWASRAIRTKIRLRHLRYRTELSNMGWLRCFQSFVHPDDAMDAEDTDVVDFLTRLALEAHWMDSVLAIGCVSGMKI